MLQDRKTSAWRKKIQRIEGQVKILYVIIAYDVGIERVDSVRHILKQYLTWIQNSVFEGEITLGKLEEMRILVSHVIDKEKDSVVVYSLSNPAWVQKVTWGIDKGTTDNVI